MHSERPPICYFVKAEAEGRNLAMTPSAFLRHIFLSYATRRAFPGARQPKSNILTERVAGTVTLLPNLAM